MTEPRKEEMMEFEPVTVVTISTVSEMEKLKELTKTTNIKAALRAAITYTLANKSKEA